ncbi:MAG: DUF456 domain-containing protein [Flavobacteriales bacterium]|nr:DUF456 domain-containing protein [Flavobacteriales bacterium]
MILILILAFLFLLTGILGSIIPGLPGPPISYLGILLLHFFTNIQFGISFLWLWAFVVIAISVLDYLFQAWGVKKFGGGKSATLGTFIGLFAGLIFPPIGLLVGPFLGAYLGALVEVSGDNKRAFKVAVGSFVGFLSGTFLKLGVSILLLYYAIHQIWFS